MGSKYTEPFIFLYVLGPHGLVGNRLPPSLWGLAQSTAYSYS